MDLEEWELLQRVDGFVDLDENGLRKIVHPVNQNYHLKNVCGVDSFICSSQDPQETIQPSSPTRRSRIVPSQLVPVPISWEPIMCDEGIEETDSDKEITKLPVDVKAVAYAKIKNLDPRSFEADQDPVSQASFNKVKGNEFVDMKMDSPRSNSSRMSSNLPQIYGSRFAFDESMEAKVESSRKKEDWEESDGKLNIWKVSLNGVGAICSFGVAAAATICIIFFGSNQKNKSQRLRLKIYSDDRMMKQVVRNATKLNEAISAVRGVPVTRAHISYGGYYSGL